MKILDKKIRRQVWKISRKGRESQRVMLSETKARKQKLPDKQIIELARIGRQVEEHYNAPQYIEWAVEKNKILILQSRNITALALRDGIEKEQERRKRLEAVKGKILIEGLAASPGIVTGKARIVPGVEKIETVKEGDIIATKMTNADWVPVMKKASGIITEKGGTTCHAAIVSRELGIPCVVGTENATIKLANQKLVTLNGYSGRVYEGKVELEIPKKTPEKIIMLEDIEMLEKAVELEPKKQGEIRVIQPETVFVKPEPGLKGMAKMVSREKEAREKIQREREELKRLKEKRVRGEGELESREREREDREKFAEEEEAREIIEGIGEKRTEPGESELEKASIALERMLKKTGAGVKVNVSLPGEAEKASKTGADGVGLLRAEHMITAAGIHPAEYPRLGQRKELIESVKNGIETVLREFKGKPVWYRTFDARTDEYRNLKGGEKEPKEKNPVLGWHGIRRDLDEPELLKAQFLAIKKLLEDGYSRIGIMLPFVHSAEQLRKAKEIASKLGLKREKGKLEFGIMIETPASALAIEEIIKEGIDFVSFGTDGLTQLTLGLDRNNERIQKHFDEIHPSVLRQLKSVIEKCKKASIHTSICGQAASNQEMAGELVRYGIDSLSADIDAVEEVRHTVLIEEKRMILESLKKRTHKHEENE